MEKHFIITELQGRKHDNLLITQGNNKWLLARVLHEGSHQVICIDNFSKDRIYIKEDSKVPHLRGMSRHAIRRYLDSFPDLTIIQAKHLDSDPNYVSKLHDLNLYGYMSRRTVTRLLSLLLQHMSNDVVLAPLETG